MKGRQALEGIRVLDLSWGIAGPLGVLLLAEHGADVVKIEPPGGDPFRAYDGYRVWNRSRRSAIVDLKSDAGREAFARLLASADVLVESFRPGVLGRLGFPPDELVATHPRLITMSIAPYPPGHPLADRPGYDALVQASSGQMWEQSGWRPGPVFLHLPMPSMGAFYLVTLGVLGALLARERTGRGQRVETSLFQGALLYTTMLWQDVQRPERGYHEVMARAYPPAGSHQQMIFECAGDEWLHLSYMSGLAPTRTADEVVGVEPGSDDGTRRARFREWNRDDLVAAFRDANHAAEAVARGADILRHPQTVANGTVVVVEDPDRGPLTQMGVPIHLLGTPGAVRGPQPRPGEHTDQVLAEAGFTAAEIDALRAAGAVA